MSNSISGGISFVGLGNGTDFTTMIEQLKKVEEIPKNRLTLWKADWQKRTDAFEVLLQNVKDLSSKLGTMSSMTSFLKKAVTSSDTATATATAKSTATEGMHSIDVKQLASNAFLSNKHLFTDKKDIVAPTDGAAMQYFEYTYKGTTRSLEIPAGTTLETLVKIINDDSKNLGVQASLVKSGAGYVFQFSGKDSGAGAALSISPGTTLPDFRTSSSNGYTYPSGSQIINPVGSGAKTFEYSFKGSNYSVAVPEGTTLDGLVGLINSDPSKPTALKAEKVSLSNGFSLNLATDETVSAHASTTIPALSTLPSTPFSTSDPVIAIGGDQTFAFTYRGQSYSMTVPEGSTLQDLADAINTTSIPGTPGVGAGIIKDETTGTYSLQMVGKGPAADESIAIGAGTTVEGFGSGAETWFTRPAQDAIFTLNDFEDQEYSSSSNQLEGVIEGVTVNLIKAGKATLTVTTDTQLVKDNIKEFVAGLNELLGNIQKLSKVDSAKAVETDAVKAKSQFATQKGGVLTGNYGVQLLSSRLRSLTSSNAVGFTPPKTQNGDGDIFSALASVGITIDSEQSSATFGLLVIKEGERAEGSPYMTLDEALEKNPAAVAELFAADNIASTSSPYFAYSNQMAGTTKAGKYAVSYDVVGGVPQNVKIDGHLANYDSHTGEYTLMDGKGKGLSITINYLADGHYDGEVSIKQGKINEIQELLKEELKENKFTHEQGTLIVLRNNYKDIMNGIDIKIEKETERIIKWEKTQKLKFARLDALLGRYDAMTKANEAAYKQATSSS